MNRETLQSVLRETGIDEPIGAIHELFGGCIHRVVRIELVGGRRLVGKLNRAERAGMFEEEAASLAALAGTETVFVPRTYGVIRRDGDCALLMDHLDAGAATDATWWEFGEALANLHLVEAGKRYGYDTDNHIGATPQTNAWCDDWIQFNAEHRLGHQVRLAREADRVRADEGRRLDAAIARLDRHLPRRPKPALLHGDLWSGNAMPTIDEDGRPRIAIIDPACSVGDGWADIAMMKLFGGFPAGCFEAYAASNDDREDLPQRLAAYQLYHVLNHVNLFGRGYIGQAMALLDVLA